MLRSAWFDAFDKTSANVPFSLARARGSKISKTDININKLGDAKTVSGCSTLPNRPQTSPFLSRARGSKISKTDININKLTPEGKFSSKRPQANVPHKTARAKRGSAS